MINVFSLLADFLFPKFCIICRKQRLGTDMPYLCVPCQAQLPYTGIKGAKGNTVERLFYLQFPIERASAYLYYTKGSKNCELIFALKYYNQPSIGKRFGALMAYDLRDTDFFTGIDLIVPIPLSRARFRQRGYNQAEWLAKGIQAETGIPINSRAVKRVRNNITQTRVAFYNRFENVAHIFAVSDPAALRGKHILLVDDVITFSATIRSCGQAITEACGGDIRISVLCLAMSANLRKLILTPPSLLPPAQE